MRNVESRQGRGRGRQGRELQAGAGGGEGRGREGKGHTGRWSRDRGGVAMLYVLVCD